MEIVVNIGLHDLWASLDPFWRSMVHVVFIVMTAMLLAGFYIWYDRWARKAEFELVMRPREREHGATQSYRLRFRRISLAAVAMLLCLLTVVITVIFVWLEYMTQPANSAWWFSRSVVSMVTLGMAFVYIWTHFALEALGVFE
jgi:hypothetical protein